MTHGHSMLVAMDAASSKQLLHGQEVKLAEVVVGFGACEINFSDCRCLGTVCAVHNCICQRCQTGTHEIGVHHISTGLFWFLPNELAVKE